MDTTTQIRELVERLQQALEVTVFGHRSTARLLAGAMLIGGHVLLEGPPGIAKTLLARSFARCLGLNFKRIQFTPDLMPGDVTGVTVFERDSSTFRFAPGPVFTDVLLADEINRTPPKTQSALLEAMEEGAVTVDGHSHKLSEMFMVIATQNPIEHEGTFPLPEAQLDRFLFRLIMSYPEQGLEEKMIAALSSRSSAAPLESAIAPAADAAELLQARVLLRGIKLMPALSAYIMELVRATRAHHEVMLGASPRAALHLALASKMNAALAGRDYAIPDDVKDVIRPVLNHRLILKPQLRATQHDSLDVINDILELVPPPARIEG